MAAKSTEAKARRAKYNKAWTSENPSKIRSYRPAALKAMKLKSRTDRQYRATLLWRAARNRALRAGRDFTLSLHTVVGALEAGTCQATGIAFKFDSEGRPHPFAPSIDRRDCRKGYTDSNSRIVIWAFNCACGPWGEDVLLLVAQARWPSRFKDPAGG